MANDTDTRKLFSLEEARRTLPLVQRIVADIVRVHEAMRETYLEAEALVQAERREEAETLQDALQELAHERGEFIAELDALGVELKDPASGLIDYPARYEDRIVYLCWKLGEETISHWHEIADGFAGRQSIDQGEGVRDLFSHSGQ